MEGDFTPIENQRLPTLYEVLLRQTSPPVDLWSFYTFLSQFPYAIDFLDFWIDLMAHVRLCRDYVRGVKESIEARNSELIADDAHSDESNVLLDALLTEGYLDFKNARRVSQFLRGNVEESMRISRLLDTFKQDHRLSTQSDREADEFLAAMVDDMLKQKIHKDKQPKMTRKQLINNASQICRQYLLSPQESPRYLINVPDEIRMKALHAVQSERRFDPELFEDLRNLSYDFLEMDCFPKFLNRVALHNLHDQLSDWRFQTTAAIGKSKGDIRGQRSASPLSTYSGLGRIALGLCWLGIGFWIGYVLIFLHYSRAIRVTTIVPFGIGCYFSVCGIYQVDILYSWFGVTQRLMYEKKLPSDREEDVPKSRTRVPTIFALLGGRSRLMPVHHPFIKKLLLRRGMWCFLLVVVSTAVLTVLFSCVPGKRI
ncbi:hypothetical protein ZYGR_0U01580 [Zygosaccharomyces rouxii]|uniref:ZYRO0F12232p n=2 Tax=Zygosaccharomyces rouxii TaxID=4956 RepID=C5DYD8_ZYGRC|nr:uncharacterized protein ZYRO0F12232g [Zygosaccharomyces rouxii]KAH9199558.1 hypothetical protein LQ764DRAFT_131678 [Zygosaccharomyces rouxii]GAV50302.1 hypothetical protein ZYGR_0U01580 [Zygosaccharomyces rouxii]CAR28799.1 ZYRO0F12232p [Zygosaccharomyces rouxii]